MAKWRYTTNGLQKMGEIIQKARQEKQWDLRTVQDKTVEYEKSQYKKGESLPIDLGVSYSTVSRYEIGSIKRVLDPRILGLLIDVLKPTDPLTQKPYTLQDLIYIAMEIYPEEETLKLMELLNQLQKLIENTKTLSPDDKSDTLEQIEALRQLGEHIEDKSDKKTARNLIRSLKGMFSELPTTSDLAEQGSRLLGKIANKLEL